LPRLENSTNCSRFKKRSAKWLVRRERIGDSEDVSFGTRTMRFCGFRVLRMQKQIPRGAWTLQAATGRSRQFEREIPDQCSNPLFLIRIAVPAGAFGRWIATATERTIGNGNDSDDDTER
jgi:hypothetical protein